MGSAVRPIYCVPIAFGASITLANCGLYVPAIEAGRVPSQETVDRTANFVNAVAAQVNCELGKAVNQTATDLGADWLYTWSAKTTLTVDEKSTLNPGLSLTRDVFTLVHENGAAATYCDNNNHCTRGYWRDLPKRGGVAE
jgi:hypothetical protein